VLFLSRIGIVNEKMLRKQRKYAILLVFVTSAILTPPDVMTQLMMAGPLLALYEISIWVAKVFGRKRVEEEPDEEEDNDGAITPEDTPDKGKQETPETGDTREEDELSPEEEAEELNKS